MGFSGRAYKTDRFRESLIIGPALYAGRGTEDDMRFAHEFGVTRGSDDDWFDLECSEDTPLYVDPFLVFDDLDPYWSSAHEDLTRFFGLALGYVALADGDRNSKHWLKAERMLLFPEPKELALGTSMGHPEGSGTARTLPTAWPMH